MTGAYVRIWRDGEMLNIEIDQLTDEEFEELIERYSARGEDGWMWARFLARWIRDNVRTEKGKELER